MQSMKQKKKLNWHAIVHGLSYTAIAASVITTPALVINKRNGDGIMYVQANSKESSQDEQWLHNKLLQSGLYAQVRHAEQMAKLKSNIEWLEKRIADYPDADDVSKWQNFLAQAKRLWAKYYVEPEPYSNRLLSFDF